jgi:cobalamin biosynthesis Mg chelatase CobN
VDELYVGTMSIEIVNWIWDQGLMAGFSSCLPKICAAHLLVLKPILIEERTVADMRLAICDHSCRIDLNTMQWAVQENFLKTIRSEMGLSETLPAMIPAKNRGASAGLNEAAYRVTSERSAVPVLPVLSVPRSTTTSPVVSSRAPSVAGSVASASGSPPDTSENEQKSEKAESENGDSNHDATNTADENGDHSIVEPKVVSLVLVALLVFVGSLQAGYFSLLAFVSSPAAARRWN